MIRLAISFFACVLIIGCGDQTTEPNSEAYTGPIIDVHLHAYPADGNGPSGQKACSGFAADLRYDPAVPWRERLVQRGFSDYCDGSIVGAATDEAVMNETLEAMRRNNVRGVLSGRGDLFETWLEAGGDLFIPGHALSNRPDDLSADAIGALVDQGKVEVLMEVTSQYNGIKADDPRLAPYWAMAAEKDLPVGIHIGVGPPGAPHLYPEFTLQSPRTLEPILKQYPNLRVYVVHGGFPFTDDLLAMLFMFPQLYIDVGVLQIAATRSAYYDFLEAVVDAGYVDRIMFGSDQMNWPALIDEGIAAINEAPFLTYEQKKMILHDNAVRFLRLESEG
ncbi:amidohydrolase family protein [Hyphococcus formosus]|uniref:amidohydrolase family protein n=1 Tax=Hyphococcus formosus TaxID=3143534 RepID=UPI00398B6FC2